MSENEALPRVWVSFDFIAREEAGTAFDPDYITNVLGVKPTQQNRAGDPIHKGTGRRTFTRWRISVGPIDTVAISTMLDEVVSRLSPAGHKLHTLSEEIGVEPILTCAVEPMSAMTPEITFPHAVVQWAAENNVVLAVDIMLWRRDADSSR
jgi:hypothetical protein